MTESQNKGGQEPIPPIREFFHFKNVETEKEISRVINQYEGIPDDKISDYLRYMHILKQSGLLIKIKKYLGAFWVSHKELSFTDFKGLVSLAMDKIQRDMLKAGEEKIKDLIYPKRKVEK